MTHTLPEVPEPNAPPSAGELAFRALQHTREYSKWARDVRAAWLKTPTGLLAVLRLKGGEK
jgi:hypothetical protein